MDINLANALTAVKVAVKEAADKSSIRRLQIYEDTKCKPSCSACCNRQIYITAAEALIIQNDLEKKGLWLDVERRARALLTASRDTTPIAWFKMNIMCPVLDPVTRLCTAYESRPTPCSTHFVRSDPSQCDPWSTKPGKYEPIDFLDIHEDFTESLSKIVDGYGILALRFPIPISLIFAARIKMQSNLKASEIISIIYNEFA